MRWYLGFSCKRCSCTCKITKQAKTFPQDQDYHLSKQKVNLETSEITMTKKKKNYFTDGFINFILQSGGPTWDVPKGRKDGRTSRASETTRLPSPTFNIAQLQQSFSQRGLSMDDLVALSGKQKPNCYCYYLFQ